MRAERYRDDNGQADRHQYHDEDLVIRHRFSPSGFCRAGLQADQTPSG
jgi:hypothetical protein